MSEHKDIAEFIKQHATIINLKLQQVLPEHWDMHATLKASMYYSLGAGGKRLRPILTIAATEALGGSISKALPVALAIEMIHTYSLIHDDLPAMDNDDFRRGKPTNHREFGEAMAILAGDGLLTHAFYMITNARHTANLTADQIVTLCEELSKFAGPLGMVGGQAADISGEQGVTNIEQLERIHRRKTGDLIAFSLRAGGHVAGANQQQLEALSQFGYAIGLAFQIQDDILDIVGDETKLGKQTQSDIESDKVTYPYFIGLEQSRHKVKQLTEQGKQFILAADFPYPDRLLEFSDHLVNRDH